MSAQAVEPETTIDPEVKVRQWLCEDGWIVGYSLERYGSLDRPEEPERSLMSFTGLYAMLAYRPVGPGSRSGNPQEWVLVTNARSLSRSKTKTWAMRAYWAHNPLALAEWKSQGYAPNILGNLVPIVEAE